MDLLITFDYQLITESHDKNFGDKQAKRCVLWGESSLKNMDSSKAELIQSDDDLVLPKLQGISVVFPF